MFETSRSQVRHAISSTFNKTTLFALHAVSIACCIAAPASNAIDVT
jgi:hypothetical protein